jgi:hypothetical protein
MPGHAFWPEGPVDCPFDGEIAVTKHNLMWQDTVGSLSLQGGTTSTKGQVYPASELPDQGSEAANQAYFSPRFMGVAAESLTALQERDTILIKQTYIGAMTIDSGTYYQGDLLAPCELASGTQLSNVKVKKTTTASSAIGYVRKGGASVTQITACLISRRMPVLMPMIGVTNSAGMVMDDGAAIAFNTTTGSQVGTAANQKLAFWGATPVVQPSGAGQAAVVITGTTAMNTAWTTSSSPFGFDTNDHLNTVLGQVDALAVDVLALNTLVNTLRGNLVTAGLIKGSA